MADKCHCLAVLDVDSDAFEDGDVGLRGVVEMGVLDVDGALLGAEKGIWDLHVIIVVELLLGLSD